MAVTLSTDLVADVMRAADPSRLREAVARLGADRASMADGQGSFRNVLAQADVAASSPTQNIAAWPQSTGESVRATTPSAERGLDQLLWHSLFETMLPREQSGVFGTGPSAGIWRSWMADRLASVSAFESGIEVLPESGSAPVPVQGAPETAAEWPYFYHTQISSFAG